MSSLQSFTKKPLRPLVALIVFSLALGAIINATSLFSPSITGRAIGMVYVNVSCTTSITLTNNTVAFGALVAGQANDTTDNGPYPFSVRNDGNVPVNISVRATSLFVPDNPSPTLYYQFACGNKSLEFNCTCNINATSMGCGGINGQINGSQITFANIPLNSTAASLAVYNLTFEDWQDEVEVDINISAPSNTSAGGKSSQVSIEATSNKVAGECP